MISNRVRHSDVYNPQKGATSSGCGGKAHMGKIMLSCALDHFPMQVNIQSRQIIIHRKSTLNLEKKNSVLIATYVYIHLPLVYSITVI